MNKKVIGARQNDYDGIRFKSLLEKRIYIYLKEKRYNFTYENEKIVIQEGFKPNTPFIKKKGTSMSVDNTRVRGITYTPDFVVYTKDTKIYVEAKGFKTDSYNIKVKMFRKKIDDEPRCVFTEVKSVKELETVLNIYK